jgi:wyosine [tRNA(Phe)-imidazoG37] synthetase (radical SAM superfamily)
MTLKYIFGPIPSRRLGISLGIDLIPYKTCTLNCVYCECGRTTNLSLDRKEYVPIKDVLKELDSVLKKNPKLDYITYSGSGEPTMHSGIGDITEFIKNNYPQYRIALLTNGTLFNDEKLLTDIKDIDLIIPSLDAVSDIVFKKINRPHKDLNAKEVIKGLIRLRKEYKGEIWLEVFIIPDLNDTEEEIKLFKDTIKEINPDRIQLNTLDRPGTEKWVEPASQDKLNYIASYLGEKSEIIAEFKSREGVESFSEGTKDSILEIIKRRPLTSKDLSNMLGLHINEINKYIQVLLEKDIIKVKAEKRGNFYFINKDKYSDF